MLSHQHPVARESDSFLPKSHPLFQARVAAEQNPSTRSEHPLPRQTWLAYAQSPCHLPGTSRKSRSLGDSSVRGDLSFGYSPHSASNLNEHLLSCSRSFDLGPTVAPAQFRRDSFQCGGGGRLAVSPRGAGNFWACNETGNETEQQQASHDENIIRWLMLPGDVIAISGLIANAYLIQSADGSVLIDTGVPGFHKKIVRAASAQPSAIILTHGHFDHAGSALTLAELWNVPIYAHPLELPYLTGITDYPAPNLDGGGAMATFARLFGRTRGFQLGTHVRALPHAGAVPGVPGWRWLHTPGHTPGHVSLFRDADGTLIAGDAVATMDLDSFAGLILQKPGIFRPPAPFTSDWTAAYASIKALDQLRPRCVAAGHGHVYNGWCYPANK